MSVSLKNQFFGLLPIGSSKNTSSRANLRAPREQRRAMETENRHRLLVIGRLPPQLRALLETRYDLIERGNIAGPAQGFEVAVTTSVDGASLATLSEIPDLKLLACNGAGLETIAVAEAERRGIAVCNTPDAVTQDTAEFAIALVLALGRNVLPADQFVRSGKWEHERLPASNRLAGRTLGIVGMGRIGRAVAARAVSLGMVVRYTSRTRRDLPYPFDPRIHDLAEQSDFLLLSLTGGPGTRHLIDAGVLSRLGPRGFLVNVARGDIVDEAALIEALRTGTIAGAGLDVFSNEPIPNPAFFELENLILAPHYAAATEETRSAMASRLKNEIDAFFRRRD